MGLSAGRAAAPALLVALLAALTVGGAWVFQLNGLPPCELCLTERLPYYGGAALAFLVAAAAARGLRRTASLGYGVLAAVFAASAALGAYHAGVEWHLWAGPSGCTGAVEAPAAVGDFLKQLQTVRVVRCDAAALRISGLSLAGWNAVVSAALALVALGGLRAAWPARAGAPDRTRALSRRAPPDRRDRRRRVSDVTAAAAAAGGPRRGDTHHPPASPPAV